MEENKPIVSEPVNMYERRPEPAKATEPTAETVTEPQSPRISGTLLAIRNAIATETLAPEEEARRIAEIVETFKHIDTSPYVKKKQGLSYLSWAKAWELVLEHFPDARFDVISFDDLPFQNLGKRGANVYTAITINGVMRAMWLPVMDLRNKTLPVEQITVTEWNKSVMRCLVKNLGLFDLGLSVYNGEDISEAAAGDVKELQARIKQIITLGKKLTAVDRDGVLQIMNDVGGDPNPANITDMDVADKVLAALKELEAATDKKGKGGKANE